MESLPDPISFLNEMLTVAKDQVYFEASSSSGPQASRSLTSLTFPRQPSSHAQPMRIVKLTIEYSTDIASALVMFHRPFKHIWHGSRENGNKYPANCRSWLSNRSQDLSTASALNGREPALAEREFPCSSNLIVLCVQINPIRRRRFRSSKKFVQWPQCYLSCTPFQDNNKLSANRP